MTLSAEMRVDLDGLLDEQWRAVLKCVARGEIENGIMPGVDDYRRVSECVADTLEAAAAALKFNSALVAEMERILPLAETGFYLVDRCCFSAGNGYDEPREMSISWDWQQNRPNTWGEAALADDVSRYLASFTEDGEESPDLPVFSARATLSKAKGSAGHE